MVDTPFNEETLVNLGGFGVPYFQTSPYLRNKYHKWTDFCAKIYLPNFHMEPKNWGPKDALLADMGLVGFHPEFRDCNQAMVWTSFVNMHLHCFYIIRFWHSVFDDGQPSKVSSKSSKSNKTYFAWSKQSIDCRPSVWLPIVDGDPPIFT